MYIYILYKYTYSYIYILIYVYFYIHIHPCISLQHFHTKWFICMFVYTLNRVSTGCYSHDFISRFGPLSIMTDAFSVRPEVSIFPLPRSFFPAFGCFDNLIMHSGLLSSTPSLSGLKYMCMCMCVYMCHGSILRCAIFAGKSLHLYVEIV